ncbi:adenylosuccinate lyase [Ehrlichia ruminantium]|uniref:Adenylosuccinate lyase n=2 Tax=Ehrlichia ruminantium TaxID=779 RepID=A0A0H3LYY6_EHRRW|nr:adenylosuccinate lyase [Ehrlichia ruminantium]QLK54922.1 adenylosuccinate lyase [Ehrlichia ruminantium]QLK55839.1 adenylosuccinate lyase [Ehrlichia ruminantium]QLK57666.1 adenylosuccinate lyase [Ehrlichia ruminantium]UOD98126.1 adenylosuccinate lyase [Ehrlichia ruminantium]UOD99942.1 adenylosuccinate lyase [Ehrlichia ruminantium]
MIKRYSRPEMSAIWEENNKFKIWMDIEYYACEAQVKLGIIPSYILENLKNKIENFDIDRINEIESVVKHDVIAFLTYIAESTNSDIRYLHYGMTSSDVLDTCLSIQLKQSCDLLLRNIEVILNILREKSIETKYMLCMGRSHGIHAEPITFGLKFARFYAEFKRNYNRLKIAKDEISVCKISGAMGNFANIDPFVEEYVANSLGLKSESISSQVIPRDRHAIFFSTLGVIASSIENLAIEIRHLQRTELMEAIEYFSSGQKGSSAMPHKKNPIFSENLTGLSRIIRSYVIPALENVALWHERDISHSSVERCIAPDACITMDFALVRLANLLQNIILSPDNMKKNIDLSKGLVFSQRILLELVKHGLTREKAYEIIQSRALQVWDNNSNFLDELKNDPQVAKYIDNKELESLFNFNYYTKHIDKIFEKVFNE